MTKSWLTLIVLLLVSCKSHNTSQLPREVTTNEPIVETQTTEKKSKSAESQNISQQDPLQSLENYQKLSQFMAPSNWHNNFSNLAGFGPESGPEILTMLCPRWFPNNWLGSPLDLSFSVIEPDGTEVIASAFCIRKNGVHKFTFRKADSSKQLTLHTFTVDTASLLSEALNHDNWTSSLGSWQCKGLLTEQFPATAYCVSWQFTGKTNSLITFELRNENSHVLSTGTYLSDCRGRGNRYEIYAVDQISKKATRLVKATRWDDPLLSSRCIDTQKVPIPTPSLPDISPELTYKVVYQYKVGYEVPDNLCKPKGTFHDLTATQTITLDAYKVILTRPECLAGAKSNEVICRITSNCSSSSNRCVYNDGWGPKTTETTTTQCGEFAP